MQIENFRASHIAKQLIQSGRVLAISVERIAWPIAGVFSVYRIREFPGLALFASIGGLAGIGTQSNQSITPVNRRDEL